MAVRLLSEAAPWRYEIRFHWPSGRLYRERRRATVTGKTAAVREAEKREAFLLAAGEGALAVAKAPAPPPAPTLREFGPRWIEGHAKALQQKRSGIATKEMVLRTHLYPAFGALRLDHITTERVAQYCAGKATYSRKTLGNHLAVLAKLLRVAVDWDVLPAMPCKIRIQKAQRSPPTFYEQETMRRLIDAAAQIDARTHALILLGLHAGLRRGEILGLEWPDVSVERRQITVRRNVISRILDTPKSGHGRVIDLSAELTAALQRHRDASPKTGRVFLQDSGRPALAKHLYRWTEAAMARAGIPKKKGVKLHVMRHSACSALAAMGAPMIAIQSLAGHESPQTTAKYMHLAAGVQAAAVRLFDEERGSTGARVDSEP
jgi:integrase